MNESALRQPTRPPSPITASELLALCPTKSTSARALASIAWRRLGGFGRMRRIDYARVARFVFVCKGNVCRSPYAEALALASGLKAASFGLRVQADAPPHPAVVQLAAERGLELRAGGSHPSTAVDIHGSDLLVAMEPWQATELARIAAPYRAQVTLLGLWAQVDTPYIPDPFGQPLPVFARCFDVIGEGVAAMTRRVLPRAEPTL